MKHLKYCQKDLYEKIVREFESPRSKSKQHKVPVLTDAIPYSMKSREYQTKLLNLAITLSCPNNSIHEFTSGTPLRQLLDRLNPKFQFPHSEEGLKTILEEVRKEIIIPQIAQELEIVDKVCVLADIWSVKGNKNSFLGVVVCYLNVEGDLLIRFLKMQHMTQSHTGIYIKQLSDQILESYGIAAERVIRYVSDSGANVKKAFSAEFETYDPITLETDMEETYVEEKSTANENPASDEISIPKWFSCVIHCLNLCLSCTKSQQCLNPAIEKLLKWLKKLRKSSMHQVIIERSGKAILIPPRVRWAYLAIALKRALYLKDTLNELYPESVDSLSVEEWSHVEKTEKVYALFFESMNKLQYVQEPTMSMVYRTIMCLVKDLETHDYILSQQAIMEIQSRFDRILNPKNSNFEPLPLLATFLDPSTSYLVPEDLIERLIDVLIRLVTQDGRHKLQENTVSFEMTQGSKWATHMLERKMKALATPNIGLKKYLRDWYHNTSPPTNRVNPVKYWLGIDNSMVKPLMPVVYEVFTCLPATSIIESYFSSAGELTTGRKNRTGPHLLDLKIFVYLNRHIVEDYIASIE